MRCGSFPPGSRPDMWLTNSPATSGGGVADFNTIVAASTWLQTVHVSDSNTPLKSLDMRFTRLLLLRLNGGESCPRQTGRANRR